MRLKTVLPFLAVSFLIVFTMTSNMEHSEAQLPIDPSRQVVWSPDGNFLAVSTGEDKVEIRDTSLNIIAEFPLERGDKVVLPIWSPNSDAIAIEVGIRFNNQRLVIWYFNTGTLIEVGEDVLFGQLGDHPVWNADGTRIAVVRTRTLSVINTLTGEAIHQMPFGNIENGDGISNIAWSPDGASLLVEDTRGIITLLDGQTYAVEATFLGAGENRTYTNILWTADNQYFAATSTLNKEILIYDSLTQSIVRTFSDPPGVLDQWLGNTMVLATGIDSAALVDSDTFQIRETVTMDVQSEWIGSASWDPISNRFAYTLRSKDLTPLPEDMVVLRLHNVAPLQSIGGFIWQDLNADGLQPGEESNGIADVTVNLYDATDTQVATTTTASDGTYTFEVEPDTPYTIEVIPPDGFTFTTPDVGEDDTLDSDIDPATGCTPPITIAVGQSDDTWDGGLLSGDDRQATFQLSPRVAEIAWSPQGDRIAVVVRDGAQGTVIVYDAATLEEIGNITGLVITSIDWKSDGTQLAVLKSNGPAIINVWDVTTDPFTLISEYQDSRIGARMLSWRPNSNEISLDSADAVRSIDAQTGTVTREFIYSRNYTTGSLKWSPDGSRLLTDIRRALIWDGDSGQLMTEISTGSGGFDWSPDGDSFVVDQDNNVQILDAQTGNVLMTLEGDFETRAGLSWEGSVIVSGRSSIEDFGIYLWDANTGQILRRVEPLDLPVVVALSPDGTRLAYGTEIEAGDTLHIVNTTEVSGLIWQDTNTDGLQTGEETSGIADVTVNLYDAADSQVATTTTASDGTYSFEVEPDTPYTIEVIPPDGFTFTTPDVGEDETLDSDIDPATGRTPPITVTTGQSDDTWDAGVVFYDLDEEEDFGER